MGNHSPLFEAAMNAELERLRRESTSRYEHPLAMKLLAAVGSVPPAEARFDSVQKPIDTRHFSVDRGGAITGPHGAVFGVNEFMSALGRDLWRRQYAMEREAFEPWIDFGGES